MLLSALLFYLPLFCPCLPHLLQNCVIKDPKKFPIFLFWNFLLSLLPWFCLSLSRMEACRSPAAVPWQCCYYTCTDPRNHHLCISCLPLGSSPVCGHLHLEGCSHLSNSTAASNSGHCQSYLYSSSLFKKTLFFRAGEWYPRSSTYQIQWPNSNPCPIFSSHLLGQLFGNVRDPWGERGIHCPCLQGTQERMVDVPTTLGPACGLVLTQTEEVRREDECLNCQTRPLWGWGIVSQRLVWLVIYEPLWITGPIIESEVNSPAQRFGWGNERNLGCFKAEAHWREDEGPVSWFTKKGMSIEGKERILSFTLFLELHILLQECQFLQKPWNYLDICGNCFLRI